MEFGYTLDMSKVSAVDIGAREMKRTNCVMSLEGFISSTPLGFILLGKML